MISSEERVGSRDHLPTLVSWCLLLMQSSCPYLLVLRTAAAETAALARGTGPIEAVMLQCLSACAFNSSLKGVQSFAWHDTVRKEWFAVFRHHTVTNFLGGGVSRTGGPGAAAQVEVRSSKPAWPSIKLNRGSRSPSPSIPDASLSAKPRLEQSGRP